MSHTVVVIGNIGSKCVYLDVPVEEAVERFKRSELRGFNEYDNVVAFTIEDEFRAYDAWPLRWVEGDLPIPESIMRELNP
jgi:hypothetical protein